MSNDEMALTALIVMALRSPVPLTEAEIGQFMREYDEGLHPVTPEDEAALNARWEEIKEELRQKKD